MKKFIHDVTALQGFDKICRQNISFLSHAVLMGVGFLNFFLSLAEIQQNSRDLRKENSTVSLLAKITRQSVWWLKLRLGVNQESLAPLTHLLPLSALRKTWESGVTPNICQLVLNVLSCVCCWIILDLFCAVCCCQIVLLFNDSVRGGKSRSSFWARNKPA